MNAKKAKAARRLARQLADGAPDLAYEITTVAKRTYVDPGTDKTIKVPMQQTRLGTSVRKTYKRLKQATA